MNSVWSSLLPTHGAPALAYTPAAAPDPASGPVLPQPSIWSRIPLATEARAAAASASAAAAEQQSHPLSQLFHPRYTPGDRLVFKKLEQARVKPLEVSAGFGSAGLTERPQQSLPLWGDSTRARMPHTADHRRVRAHNTDGRDLFDITPAPAAAVAAPVPRRRALHPEPPSDAAALANLRLTNPSTHVPRGPSQLLPFATLTAEVRPSPLSVGGFRPLLVEHIQERWAISVGVQPASTEQKTATQDQQPRRSALRTAKPMEEEKEQPQEQEQNDIPASARQRQRQHDMATSPMAHAPRGGLTLGKQQQADMCSVALSPMAQRNADGPASVAESDAHILAQSEHVHKYSVKALKAQLEDLKREERAIDREHRAAQKSALHAQVQWEGLVGLSAVPEADHSLNESAAAESDPSAPLRHALALDDEHEAGTQTDGTLELRHPRKPRIAGRKGSSSSLHDSERLTSQQKVEAEVALEFEQKRAATFGAPKNTALRPGNKPATGALPPFKSYADSYREQLQKQDQVVFDAQVAAAQHPPDSRAGQLVEARMKKMRDELLFSTNPYRSAREYQRRAAALAEAEANPNLSPEEAMEKQYHETLDMPVPETIIGSRTAALLFTDPHMMQRKPLAAAAAAGASSVPAPNPHTSDIPNKIVEFTEQNRAALRDALGFEIPRPTFPENVGQANVHRPLRFQPVRPHDPNHVDIPLQRLTSAQIQSVGPEVEALFRVDDKISAMDMHNLFAGAPPMRALKNECVDLDNDVHRLENTIRALHAEFSQPPPQSQLKKPGEHALVPGYDEMRDGSASARSSAANAQADARQIEAAQAYLNKMDRVIGVPSLASPRAQASRSSSASALHSAHGAAPSSPHQSRAGLRSPLHLDRRSSADSAIVPARGTTTSKLVAALEQYLSLEVPADMLPPPTTQALRVQSADHTAATLHFFPVAPHDLNRLPEFTPQSLSPSYAKAKPQQLQQPQQTQMAAGPLSPSRKQQQQQQQSQPPQSRSHHMHHSWESDLLAAQHAAAADEREQAHVEQMLQEQINDMRMTPDYQRRGSNQLQPRPSSRQSPNGGVRSSLASLSRVTESEHEDSRSYGSATDRSGKSPQHQPTQMQVAPPLSSRSHRGGGAGGAGIDYEDSNDSRWSESEDDQSIVMHVPQHQQQVPINFEDSMESNPPHLSARNSQQQQQQQQYHPQQHPPQSSRGGSLSGTLEKPRALLSPSAAQQQRSPTHQQVVPAPASLARPTIEPRTNRAAELKKAQLAAQQQKAQADATPPRSPRSPRRAQQQQQQQPQHHYPPSSMQQPQPQQASRVAPEPVVARKKSAIELERERRRLKQLQGGGMMRSSQDRLQSPTPPAASGRTVGAGAAVMNLSSSNDRLMREAHAMMDQFRAQMDAMPDLPGEGEYSQQQQPANPYHSDEFRPDVNHRQSYQQQQQHDASWEHDVAAAPIDAPTHPDDDDNVWYSHPPAVAQSWEDELAKADEAHNSARAQMQRNPLDDDDDDLFR